MSESIPAPDLNWWEMPLWKWRNDRDPEGVKEEPDWQRQRAYDAESDSGVKTAPQHSFGTIEECQVYANMVTASIYFKRRFGDVTIEIIYKQSGSAMGTRKGPNKGKVWLPRWAFKEWVILHEIAHCVTPRESGGGHGRRWCRAYLDLVRYHLGRSWETKLRQAFLKKGVKTSTKRPPNVIGASCAALRSQYYTPSKTVKLEPANDVFPETTTEVCDWITKHLELPQGSVKMRRVLVPGLFEFTDAPGLKHPITVEVFRLSDLNFGEWLHEFTLQYRQQLEDT